MFKKFYQCKIFSACLGPLSYNPIKESKPSYLSSESKTDNYRGFMNLGLIILITANFRLVVENFMKYGLLIKYVSPTDYFTNYRNYPCFSATLGLLIFVLNAFFIERHAFSDIYKVNYNKITLFNVLNIAGTVICPYILIVLVDPMPRISN